jgi:hypothetical protein
VKEEAKVEPAAAELTEVAESRARRLEEAETRYAAAEPETAAIGGQGPSDWSLRPVGEPGAAPVVAVPAPPQPPPVVSRPDRPPVQTTVRPRSPGWRGVRAAYGRG